MLSAPILNPIVIASTYAAFGGGTRGWELVGGRCGLGLIIAIAAGVFVTRRGGPLLRAATPDEHDHEHEHGGRAQTFSDHLVGDFVGMGRFLVLGAGLSALLQTVVPQDVLSGVAGDLILAPLAMMALAFLLSLLLAGRRVRGHVVRRLRPGRPARLPRDRADGRHQARRALRGHVPPRIRACACSPSRCRCA